MAIRGTKPVDPELHKTKPAYQGDEIALGITYQMAIGEKRSIVIQTHVIRDCPVEELNALFDKVATALDRVNSKYRMQELKTLKEQHEKQLGLMVEDYGRTMEKHETSWAASGRRGEFKLDGNQKSWQAQQLGTQDRYKKELTAISTEIAALEQQIGA